MLTVIGVVIHATTVVAVGVVGLAAGAYGVVDARRKLAALSRSDAAQVDEA